MVVKETGKKKKPMEIHLKMIYSLSFFLFDSTLMTMAHWMAACRQQLNNAIHLSQQLNAILPSAEDCPAPPPPSPSTVQRQRNNGTASENGRLPLISSLHSGKKIFSYIIIISFKKKRPAVKLVVLVVLLDFIEWMTVGRPFGAAQEKTFP